jgi:hypothetical protein
LESAPNTIDSSESIEDGAASAAAVYASSAASTPLRRTAKVPANALAGVTVIADEAADHGAILLLDPVLIVLAVR